MPNRNSIKSLKERSEFKIVKIIRRISPLLLSFLLSINLFGCGEIHSSSEQVNSYKKSSDKIQIAFIPKTLNKAYYTEMESGARKAVQQFNIDLICEAPEQESDFEKQVSIMEKMVSKKVDAILIAPSSSKEIAAAIKKANAAGIPVILIDTKMDNAIAKSEGIKVATFVGSDNYNGGKIAAEYMIKKLNGKGKIAILEGIKGQESNDTRILGFKDDISSSPNIQIVASKAANWDKDQGCSVFKNILASNPDIEGLFAADDVMALGAIKAIEEVGKTGKITVLGFNNSDSAQKAIKEGELDGSVAQYPAEMGRLSVENAVELIKGGSTETNISTRVELITKYNLK